MGEVISSNAGVSDNEKLPPQRRLNVVAQPALRAHAKKRHWGLLFSFLILVIIPLMVSAAYLYLRAVDQYESVVGFSVRAEEVSSPIELLGGIAGFSGSSSSDTDILYEYIQSQELVQLVDDRLNLRDIYAGSPDDPVFSIDPDGTLEDLRDYWALMTDVDYDSGTGLIEFQVRAFTPEDAQNIAKTVFAQSSEIVNDLSSIARQDAIRYAQEDLEISIDRLKQAREAMTSFRAKSQIVDPSEDIQSQMGLIGSLQEQLAEALITLQLLRQTTTDNDTRIEYATKRINVIEGLIAEQRQKFGLGGDDALGNDFVTVIAEFEGLSVDQEFAEEAYITSLASFYAAQAEAQRKSRYLAAYIQPTLAQEAEYPRREILLATIALFLLVGWSIMALVYYSVRDRR